jgi:hypothetical protein
MFRCQRKYFKQAALAAQHTAQTLLHAVAADEHHRQAQWLAGKGAFPASNRLCRRRLRPLEKVLALDGNGLANSPSRP